MEEEPALIKTAGQCLGSNGFSEEQKLGMEVR